jgi:hypothetical protein
VASALARRIRGRGISVFLDTLIPPGAPWPDVLQTKLTNCRIVVVVWSDSSVSSRWVREEAEFALSKGKLLPVTISKGLRLPLGFGAVHAADLSDWDGRASGRHLAALMTQIASRCPADVDQMRRSRKATWMTVAQAMALQVVGGGLFLVAPLARRRWLYPAIPCAIALSILLARFDVAFFTAESGRLVAVWGLLAWIVSTIDVIVLSLRVDT